MFLRFGDGGGKGDEKCRVGDRTRTDAGRYLVMEQGPTTIDEWAQRTKRRRFHYFTHTPRSLHRPRQKRGHVHYNQLFFTSEEILLNNHFVCP
jgi:hypothetical protein